MQHRIPLALIVGSFALVGCSESSPTAVEDATSPTFRQTAGSAGSQSPDLILNLVDGAFIHSATLRRNKNTVTFKMKASVPSPNTATMWAAIFNVPGECAQQLCGPSDFGNPAVKGSLLRAGGRVIGGGPVTMTGQVREGDTSEALFGPGLMNAMTAEIHFVYSLHGPQIPTMVDDQIHYIDGGCAVQPCADAGVAIFASPM